MIRYCAFKISYCKKQHMYCFFPFGFMNVIIFVINPCRSYLKFAGAELWVKVCFGSFGSIRTNLRRSVACLVRQSYCNYLYCLVFCCLYFSYKKDTVWLFFKNVFRMVTTKKESLEHPLINFDFTLEFF